MKIEQVTWTEGQGWGPDQPGKQKLSAQLVFLFGSRQILTNADVLAEARAAYPEAYLLGCSTAGEICGTVVLDDSLVSTAIEFSHTRLRSAAIKIGDVGDSRQTGERLAQLLPREELIHVFVLSEGLNVNGSELVTGLTRQLPEGVGVTGGLSGDGTRFQKTVVLSETGTTGHAVVAIGFYGSHLRVGYGSMGGWDTFGPERLITRSKANVLFELDGKSALELYKQYLGEHSRGLPATGLLFPLSLRKGPDDTGVVRTILSVSEVDQSMTFAGDVPEGSYVRLMKSNFDRLIDGAIGAAKTSFTALGSSPPELAILISCVGRKMVLKQRIEEELEGVRSVMGQDTIMTGFYSYGEICPFTLNAKSELHNQTMTITAFAED